MLRSISAVPSSADGEDGAYGTCETTACISICGYAKPVANSAVPFARERIPKVEVGQFRPNGKLQEEIQATRLPAGATGAGEDGREVAKTLEGDLEGRAWLLIPLFPRDSAGRMSPRSLRCLSHCWTQPSALVVCPLLRLWRMRLVWSEER